MYTVKQVINGRTVFPVTVPLTLLQTIKWIESAEELLSASWQDTNSKFYIIRQTKEDIIKRLKDVPDDWLYWTVVFPWINIATDFDEYWEDYV